MLESLQNNHYVKATTNYLKQVEWEKHRFNLLEAAAVGIGAHLIRMPTSVAVTFASLHLQCRYATNKKGCKWFENRKKKHYIKALHSPLVKVHAVACAVWIGAHLLNRIFSNQTFAPERLSWKNFFLSSLVIPLFEQVVLCGFIKNSLVKHKWTQVVLDTKNNEAKAALASATLLYVIKVYTNTVSLPSSFFKKIVHFSSHLFVGHTLSNLEGKNKGSLLPGTAALSSIHTLRNISLTTISMLYPHIRHLRQLCRALSFDLQLLKKCSPYLKIRLWFL